MADVLTINSGLKRIELKDEEGHSVEVCFNPYDANFMFGLVDAAERLDAKQSELEGFTMDDWKAYYSKAKETDKAMRTIIDGLFNVPVCDALFPNLTVFAVGDGLPIWANLLYAIVDQMEVGTANEKKRMQERIRKYSSKYKKK